MKTCSTCLAVKPLDAFGPRSSSKDGRMGRCRDCYRVYQVRWREAKGKEIRAYERKYRQRNLEKMRAKGRKFAVIYKDKKQAYDRKYQKANAERAKLRPSQTAENRKVYVDQWRAKNKDKVNVMAKRYRQKNLGKILTYNMLRKARQKGCEGSYTEQEWRDLCQRYGNRCLRCGRADVKLTVDHIIPIVHQGRNDITNLQPLCRACNSAKGARNTVDYRPA